MKKLAFLILVSILTTVIVVPNSFAQNAMQTPIGAGNAQSSVAAPAPMPLGAFPSATGHGYWGFDLGLTYSWLSGANNFFWPVTTTMADGQIIDAYMLYNSSLGSGIGGILGVKGAIPLSNSLDLEGKLRYLSNYTSASNSEPLPNSTTGQFDNVSNTYNLLTTNLDLAVLLHIALSHSWYAAAGLSFSDLLGNSFNSTQTPPPGDFYNDVNGNPTTTTQLNVNSFSWANTFSSTRTDLQLGGGTVFPLSGSTLLDAELLLSIPLSSWMSSAGQNSFNNDADFYTARYAALGQNVTVAHPTYPNLWYASLTIGIRFPFGGHSENANSSSETSNGNSAIGDDGKVALRGRVTDAKTGDPVDADLTVVDLTNNQVVANDHTDGDGNYNVRVKAPGKYSVTADANGYLFGTAYFEVDPEGRILSRHPDIKLGNSSSGGRTRLLVFFDFNSATLNSSSYPELNRAVRLMKAVPSMKVEIAGYSDSIGDPQYNMKLSGKRANAVRDYLVQNGVDAGRVTAHGYGMASPIADNSTDEGRAENRRVEFVVQSN